MVRASGYCFYAVPSRKHLLCSGAAQTVLAADKEDIGRQLKATINILFCLKLDLL